MPIKTIRKAFAKLRNAYAKRLTSYPRVDNDYNKERKATFYPHPPLSPFDPYAQPLKDTSYPYKKDTFPLVLANENIATSTTIEGIMVVVDRYNDDKMQPRTSKKEELDKKMELFSKHLKEQGMETRPFNPNYGEGIPDDDIASIDTRMIQFKFKLEPSHARKKTIDEVKPKRRRDSRDNYKHIALQPGMANSFREAMETFKLRKIKANRTLDNNLSHESTPNPFKGIE
ncbi:MAG: Unknown protein [uncultured Sulfurovum sp.]|uniref:Uncharacterized protein n=1 Tax=uncultured Sulfurovum sp. TaxID=269237 RepID=A0A6S6SKE2_9BACT|nr:MAG: Unknown protein [uncultured Sulfurovum sp.]